MIKLLKTFWVGLVLMIGSIVLPAYISFDSVIDVLIWPGLLIVGVIISGVQFYLIKKKEK